MQTYKRMSKSTIAALALTMMATGAVASIGAQTYAQTAPTNGAAQAITSPEEKDTEVTGAEQDAETAAVLPTGGISEVQARAAITAANPGTTITRIELEDEDGVMQYNAKLANGTEVTVDAKTGAVTTEQADKEDGKGDASDTETNDGADGQNEGSEVGTN
jgi:uncharacterized membrane protein YkoI